MLSMDVVKINGVRFLVATSCVIQICIASKLTSAEIPILVKNMSTIAATYEARGFSIYNTAAANIFKPMAEDPDFIVPNITLNIMSEDEHKLVIERIIVLSRSAAKLFCYIDIPTPL